MKIFRFNALSYSNLEEEKQWMKALQTTEHWDREGEGPEVKHLREEVTELRSTGKYDCRTS